MTFGFEIKLVRLTMSTVDHLQVDSEFNSWQDCWPIAKKKLLKYNILSSGELQDVIFILDLGDFMGNNRLSNVVSVLKWEFEVLSVPSSCPWVLWLL